MTGKIQDKAKAYHRWGLDQARTAARFVLAGRDHAAPKLDRTDAVTIPLPGRDLTARLYVPTGATEPGPLMVFFHGGGFVIGDIETHDALCHRLADAAKVRVLSVDYRLAPEHPFPAQIDDGFDVMGWVFDNAASLGADPRRVAIGGDSAGAYVAVATVLRLPGQITAQLLLYPLLHLEDDIWAESLLADSRIVGRLAVRYIRACLAEAAIEVPSLLGSASALTPPTIVVTGGVLDPVRPDALVYVRELQAIGATCHCRQYGGQAHGFLNLTHVSPQACAAITEFGGLLATTIAGARP